MTPDEALERIEPAVRAHPLAAEALDVLRSGLQHARVLARAHQDAGMPANARRLALRRFTEWDEGRRA